MEKLIKSLPYITIGMLLIIIFGMNMCTEPKVIEKPIVTEKVDTVWKTVTKIEVRPGPTIIKYLPGEPVPMPVDTAAILEDYFAKVVQEDKIELDSFGYVNVRDTVSRNRIQSRVVEKSYTFPTITKTITIDNPPKKVNQVYAGFSVIGNKQKPINYLGGDLYLKTKEDKLYTIGAGIDNNTNLNVKLGLAWKLKIK